MDLIICASISRFARNFSDCMTQIAALKTMHPAHPIGVYFETENIYTLNPSSQYSLDIQALLADWESGNKSRRMVLSYDQRIMTGQYPVADLMGYKPRTRILKHIASKSSKYGAALEYLIFKHDELRKTPILDQNGNRIMRDEFYLDGLNCEPYSFDNEI